MQLRPRVHQNDGHADHARRCFSSKLYTDLSEVWRQRVTQSRWHKVLDLCWLWHYANLSWLVHLCG